MQDGDVNISVVTCSCWGSVAPSLNFLFTCSFTDDRTALNFEVPQWPENLSWRGNLSKKGVLEIKNNYFWEAPPPPCHQNCWLVWLSQKASKREKRWWRRQFCLYEGPLDPSSKLRLHPKKSEVLGLGGALRRSSGRSDFDVLWLHHLGQGLLHSEDGEAGGGVKGPTLWHQLQHGTKTLSMCTQIKELHL